MNFFLWVLLKIVRLFMKTISNTKNEEAVYYALDQCEKELRTVIAYRKRRDELHRTV